MAEEENDRPILVVDDMAEDLSLITRLLRHCKLLNPVVPLSSGDDCIQWIKNNSPPPVLVLLDLIMHPTNGLKVLAALKAMGVLDVIPVVMLSGLKDVKVIHEGYQLGARTFLVKPLNCEDLIQMITALKDVSVEDKKEGYLLTTVNPAAPIQKSGTTFFRSGTGNPPVDVRP